MRKTILMLVAFIAVAMTPYAIGAFTLWDGNPDNWPEGTRFLVSSFTLVTSLVGVIVADVIYKNLTREEQQ